MLSRDIPVGQDSDVWVRVTQYGSVEFFWDKDQALDQLRRTDSLYRAHLSDWVKL